MATRSEAQALAGLALSWRQLAGVAGIAGVMLSVVILGVLGAEEEYPDIDKSAGEIRAWFEDHGTRVQIISYASALMLSFLFVPFFLGMRSLLAGAEGGDAMWTQLAFFGATLFVLLSFAGMAYTSVLAVAVNELDDSVLTALKYAEYITLALAYGLASGIYLLGSGLVIVQTRVLWRWLGWLSLGFGVMAVVGTANIVDPDPESLFGALNFLGGAIGFGLVLLLQGVGLVTMKQEAV